MSFYISFICNPNLNFHKYDTNNFPLAFYPPWWMQSVCTASRCLESAIVNGGQLRPCTGCQKTTFRKYVRDLIGKQLLKCDIIITSWIIFASLRLKHFWHLLDGFIFPPNSHRIWRAGSLHPGLIPFPLQRRWQDTHTYIHTTKGQMDVTVMSSSLFTKAFLWVKCSLWALSERNGLHCVVK